MLKKVFLILVKYMPIIQMVAMLVSNTLYCFNVIIEEKDLPEYLVGGSLMTTILLYACSYALKLGSWHRLIVTAYIINITIATIDVLHRIPITNVQLLLSYYIVAVLFLVIIVINKLKCNKEVSI